MMVSPEAWPGSIHDPAVITTGDVNMWPHGPPISQPVSIASPVQDQLTHFTDYPPFGEFNFVPGSRITAIEKADFGEFYFGECLMIHQSFLLPKLPAIRYNIQAQDSTTRAPTPTHTHTHTHPHTFTHFHFHRQHKGRIRGVIGLDANEGSMVGGGGSMKVESSK